MQQIQPRLSTAQMADLFRTAQEIRPAYSKMYPFFYAVFSAQQAVLDTCRPPAVAREPQHNTVRRRAELPLIQRDCLWVDWSSTHRLFKKLLTLAPEGNPQLARNAEVILDRYRSKNLDLEPLARALMGEDPTAFERQAGESGVAFDVLAFFLYHCLWPSAAFHLEASIRYLPPAEEWRKGYCPFCGSPPMLSVLDREGHRRLVCSFCRHVWPVPRLFCPFCESREPKSLGYFFSEKEKEYRVNICRDCKGYLKTIDLRQLTRPLFLPLEAIITMHLDMNTQEQGYRDMTPIWLRL